MRWIEKKIGTFQNCHNVLYQHAKFGGDRTTRAGCRSENWCFYMRDAIAYSVVLATATCLAGWLGVCLSQPVLYQND